MLNYVVHIIYDMYHIIQQFDNLSKFIRNSFEIYKSSFQFQVFKSSAYVHLISIGSRGNPPVTSLHSKLCSELNLKVRTQNLNIQNSEK